MNNTKAVLQAMNRKKGSQEEIDVLFAPLLVKAGFISFSYVQGPLDWLTLIGAASLVDNDSLPVLKRAYEIRFRKDKAHLRLISEI